MDARLRERPFARNYGRVLRELESERCAALRTCVTAVTEQSPRLQVRDTQRATTAGRRRRDPSPRRRRAAARARDVHARQRRARPVERVLACVVQRCRQLCSRRIKFSCYTYARGCPRRIASDIRRLRPLRQPSRLSRRPQRHHSEPVIDYERRGKPSAFSQIPGQHPDCYACACSAHV